MLLHSTSTYCNDPIGLNLCGIIPGFPGSNYPCLRLPDTTSSILRIMLVTDESKEVERKSKVIEQI